MVYLPNARFTIDTKNLRGCDIRAGWFSPVSGKYTPFDYTQCGKSTVRQSILPVEDGHLDWTLVVERSR